MKTSLGRCCLGLAGLQIAIGLTALSFLAHPAEARQPSYADRSDANRDRDNRMNGARAIHTAPSSPRYTAPARDMSTMNSARATRSVPSAPRYSRRPATSLRRLIRAANIRRQAASIRREQRPRRGRLKPDASRRRSCSRGFPPLAFGTRWRPATIITLMTRRDGRFSVIILHSRGRITARARSRDRLRRRAEPFSATIHRYRGPTPVRAPSRGKARHSAQQ